MPKVIKSSSKFSAKTLILLAIPLVAVGIYLIFTSQAASQVVANSSFESPIVNPAAETSTQTVEDTTTLSNDVETRNWTVVGENANGHISRASSPVFHGRRSLSMTFGNANTDPRVDDQRASEIYQYVAIESANRVCKFRAVGRAKYNSGAQQMLWINFADMSGYAINQSWPSDTVSSEQSVPANKKAGWQVIRTGYIQVADAGRSSSIANVKIKIVEPKSSSDTNWDSVKLEMSCTT